MPGTRAHPIAATSPWREVSTTARDADSLPAIEFWGVEAEPRQLPETGVDTEFFVTLADRQAGRFWPASRQPSGIECFRYTGSPDDCISL